MSSFCITGISSIGISTPRSPLAIIMPSETRIISSILLTPSLFSIFAMIRISEPPFFSRKAFISLISSALLVKDAATKSTSCSIPNLRSSLSLSLRKGSDRVIPGTFIPLCDDTAPPLSTLHTISVSVFSITSISIRPSSISIFVPILTSSGSPAKVMEQCSLSPSHGTVVSVNF